MPRRTGLSGLRELEYLAGIDALGIADLAEIGRINNQIAGAGAVGAAGYLPQIVAGLYDVGSSRCQLYAGHSRQRHDDALHDAGILPQLVEPQLDATWSDHLG